MLEKIFCLIGINFRIVEIVIDLLDFEIECFFEDNVELVEGKEEFCLIFSFFWIIEVFLVFLD